jgi:hypothetical protein
MCTVFFFSFFVSSTCFGCYLHPSSGAQLQRTAICCVYLWKTEVFVSIVKAIPLQALRVPGGWGSQISRQSVHEGGKIVSSTYRPPLPLRIIPGTHFRWRLSRPQGHSAAGRIMSMKKSMTSSGIEPATFRFVAHCPNHYATACP